MKVTQEGKEKIEQNLRKLEEQLASLEQEKALAYTMTGDTWHDNPYFNSLTRSEHMLSERIRDAKEMLHNAEVVESNIRNLDVVEIGSIVRCSFWYDESEPEEEVFEIVGHGESNLTRNRISYDSPVGWNLMGHKAGEAVCFDIPSGKATYKIIEFYSDWGSVTKSP